MTRKRTGEIADDRIASVGAAVRRAVAMTAKPEGVEARAGAAPLLETHGLTKAFGPVEVLSDINLAFSVGEIHAIIGENGAGKSTLMKIISGHLEPTRGSLKFDGEPLAFKGPVDAERRGVVLVHQEIMLAPDLTIAENMFLGREIGGRVALDDREMERSARGDAKVRRRSSGRRSGWASVDRATPTGADRTGAGDTP